MSGNLTIDISAWRELMQNCYKSKDEIKKELNALLEELGIELLDIIQDEITTNKNIDTSRMLQSFEKGSTGNVWNISEGDLKLEVGTNINYASFVNDGHWTNPQGQKGRWVPGSWDGDKFKYDPSSSTGMYLKQQWVEGSHYFDSAIKIAEKMFPEIIDKKVADLLSQYFGL